MGARRILAALICALLASLVLAVPALAATDMAVVSSAPAADESAAPASGRYWVQFANNVAAVPDNAKLVTLCTADGGKVDASRYQVSLPDVEVEFGYRQFVWVDVKDLDAGASYVIHVSGDLTAKNGNKLGKDVDIPFTVAKVGQEAVSLQEPLPSAGGSGNGSGSGGSKADTGSSSGSDAEVVDLTPQKDAAPQEPLPWQVLALFGLMAVAVAVALVVKARK